VPLYISECGAETRDRPLRDDLSAAGRHYAAGAKDVASQVADAAKKAAERVGDAFRQAQKS